MVSHKTCARCLGSLPTSAFAMHRKRPDGLQRWCRACNSEYQRAWRNENAAYQSAWREQHPDYHRDYHPQWRRDNPEEWRAHSSKNGAKRRGRLAPGVSQKEVATWLKQQKKVCYWCGARCARRFQIDHYTPLSRGGRHEITNLVISCQPCNGRKGAKDPVEFANKVGRLF